MKTKFEGVTEDGTIKKFTSGVLTNKKLVEIKIIDQNYDYLSCRYNKLTSLPSILPTKLQILFCHHNKITRFKTM